MTVDWERIEATLDNLIADIDDNFVAAAFLCDFVRKLNCGMRSEEWETFLPEGASEILGQLERRLFFISKNQVRPVLVCVDGALKRLNDSFHNEKMNNAVEMVRDHLMQYFRE